jgi:hypothetical protein
MQSTCSQHRRRCDSAGLSCRNPAEKVNRVGTYHRRLWKRATWPLLKWCSASSSTCRMPNLPVPGPPIFHPGRRFLYRSNGPQCCAAGYLDLHNVAPREDDQAARPGNAGERLAYVWLPTGIRVIGVNAAMLPSSSKMSRRNFGQPVPFAGRLPQAAPPSHWESLRHWATRSTRTHCRRPLSQ